MTDVILKPIRTFSRRLARTLRQRQKQLLDELLPTIVAPKNSQEFIELAGQFEQMVLEIGFGNGEFTAHFAKENPKTVLIGAEPFLNGVASLLGKIDEARITNIRVFADDVKLLLENAPPQTFAKIFIICPDPWPKARHHKRRLVTAEFLDSLAYHLKNDGVIEVVTDHAEYAEWIFEHSAQMQKMKLAAPTLDACKQLPENWLETKYQRRGLKMGAQIHRFVLSKRL